jgi:hypothetical protein
LYFFSVFLSSNFVFSKSGICFNFM